MYMEFPMMSVTRKRSWSRSKFEWIFVAFLEWLLNCYSCVDSHRILITPDKSAIWRQWRKRILTTIWQNEMEENWWYADIRCAHMMICPMSPICRVVRVARFSSSNATMCVLRMSVSAFAGPSSWCEIRDFPKYSGFVLHTWFVTLWTGLAVFFAQVTVVHLLL